MSLGSSFGGPIWHKKDLINEQTYISTVRVIAIGRSSGVWIVHSSLICWLGKSEIGDSKLYPIRILTKATISKIEIYYNPKLKIFSVCIYIFFIMICSDIYLFEEITNSLFLCCRGRLPTWRRRYQSSQDQRYVQIYRPPCEKTQMIQSWRNALLQADQADMFRLVENWLLRGPDDLLRIVPAGIDNLYTSNKTSGKQKGPAGQKGKPTKEGKESKPWTDFFTYIVVGISNQLEASVELVGSRTSFRSRWTWRIRSS